MSMPFLRVSLLALACSIGVAAPSLAETVTFKVDMTASKEVPPNPSKGKGQVTATFDTASKTQT
jgi:hypothetical protein